MPGVENSPCRTTDSSGLTGPPHPFTGSCSSRRIEPVTPWDHKDPFDRVIVAQAARRNLTIATSDTHILRAALTPTLKT